MSEEIRGDVHDATPSPTETYVHADEGARGRTEQETASATGRGRRRGGGERSMVERAEPRSYYGRPVIKPPVWKPEIPWYFFIGGLGGASSALGFVASRAGNEALARRAWATALAGLSISPILLTADLGVPRRFIYMLRVFKVTSPMNLGSWALVVNGALVAPAAAASLTPIRVPGRRVAELGAGAAGLTVATYTAALIANTAVPVWSEARRELPFAFAAGAAASAGAAAAALTPVQHAGPARRLAIGGAAAELAAEQLMEHRLGELGEPYKHGAPKAYRYAARALSAAGAATLALAGKRRRGAVAGSALILGGAVCMRWSVFKAGFASAQDPRYTVGPQRERSRRTSR